MTLSGEGFLVSYLMSQVECVCFEHAVYILSQFFCCSVEGDQEMKLHCLDVEVPYCNEYLGCQQLPVFSPRTDSYFISLTQVSTYSE